MTKNCLYFLLIFSTVFLTTNCDNGTLPTNHEENERYAARLDAIGDSLISNLIINGKDRSIPGVIIGLHSPDKNFTYLKAFGKADVINSTSLFRDDKFRIGTLTETFISTIIFRFIEDGKIKLNDPVNKFIQVPHSGGLITIKHLLSHRSGLADFTDSVKYYQNEEPMKKFSTSELLNYAFNSYPLITPDKKTEYSHTNYLLLSLVAEQVSGETIGSLIDKRIIKALNLTNTEFQADAQLTGAYSKGYVWSDSLGLSDYTHTYDYSWLWGSANMTSNSFDLMSWTKSFVEGRLISANSLQEMQSFNLFKTKETLDVKYGKGMMGIGALLGFSGETYGYHTSVYYIPSRKITIFVFTNTANDNDNLVVDVARVVLPALRVN